MNREQFYVASKSVPAGVGVVNSPAHPRQSAPTVAHLPPPAPSEVYYRDEESGQIYIAVEAGQVRRGSSMEIVL